MLEPRDIIFMFSKCITARTNCQLRINSVFSFQKRQCQLDTNIMKFADVIEKMSRYNHVKLKQCFCCVYYTFKITITSLSLFT